jgi:hypothetical protein
MTKKKAPDKKAPSKKKKPRPVPPVGGGHQGGLMTGPGNGLGR